MEQITMARILEVLNELKITCKPTLLEMQRVADRLEITYGNLVPIWESERINTALASAKMKGITKGTVCEMCGRDIIGRKAKHCRVCANIRQEERLKKAKKRSCK